MNVVLREYVPVTQEVGTQFSAIVDRRFRNDKNWQKQTGLPDSIAKKRTRALSHHTLEEE